MSIDVIEIIIKSYKGMASYTWKLVTNPFYPEGKINFFWFLIVISLIIWVLEILIPWRKNQSIFRKGFWLDTFYMFFNFFLFHLLLYTALSNTVVAYVKYFLSFLGYQGGALIDFSGLPEIWQLILFFIIADFTQWVVHYALHRFDVLWRFHKVHHSVVEMGFAAHLRYHFFETFFYQSAKYIVLSLIFGFKIEYAFIVHAFAVLIGHLNHANLGWDYGPLKYILNNPKMHIWHHAKNLPESHPYGMNFGITLSIWDYIFGTDYIPHSGRDIPLGFEDIETYPQDFINQQTQPFKELFSKEK